MLFGVIEAGDVTTLTEVLRRLFDLPYNKYGTQETINLVPNVIRDAINDVVKIPFNVTDPDAPAIKDDCDIKAILTNIGEPNPLGKKLYHNKKWVETLTPILEKARQMKTKQVVENLSNWKENFPEEQLKKLYANMHNDPRLRVVNSIIHR